MNKYLLISDEGAKLGLKTMSEIKDIAQKENLQYKIVSPQTDPPVAKLFNQYVVDKKTKKQKNVTKTIKISVSTSENDLLTKAKMIDKFLSKKYSVNVVVKMKGRLSKKPQLAKDTLESLLAMLTVNFSKSDLKFLSSWDLYCTLTPGR